MDCWNCWIRMSGLSTLSTLSIWWNKLNCSVNSSQHQFLLWVDRLPESINNLPMSFSSHSLNSYTLWTTASSALRSVRHASFNWKAANNTLSNFAHLFGRWQKIHSYPSPRLIQPWGCVVSNEFQQAQIHGDNIHSLPHQYFNPLHEYC